MDPVLVSTISALAGGTVQEELVDRLAHESPTDSRFGRPLKLSGVRLANFDPCPSIPARAVAYQGDRMSDGDFPANPSARREPPRAH